MHPTWTIFDGITEDIEAFHKKFVPEFFLRPELHTDIVQNFEVIKKLLEHSYYEYKFYDVGLLMSMTTFEMALKLRYEELMSEKWDPKKNLQQLIHWFEKKNYFEVYNEEFLVAVRKIRNHLAHPAAHAFGGGTTKQLIEHTTDLINGLYEDPLLRKSRMDLTNQFLDKLKSFTGGIKCTLNNETYFAFHTWPAFINNKVSLLEIHFYFNYCFEIPPAKLEKSNWIVPPIMYFKGTAINFTADSILLKGDNDSLLAITEIKDKTEKAGYDDWVNKYMGLCHPMSDYLYWQESLVNTSSLHLREFHKI